MPTIQFRTPLSWRIADATFAIAMPASAWFSFVGNGLSWITAGFLLASILGFRYLADSLTTRVELRDTSLFLVRKLRGCEFARENIVNIEQFKLNAVAIRLRDGKRVLLPRAGSGTDLADALRGWIQRRA